MRTQKRKSIYRWRCQAVPIRLLRRTKVQLGNWSDVLQSQDLPSSWQVTTIISHSAVKWAWPWSIEYYLRPWHSICMSPVVTALVEVDWICTGFICGIRDPLIKIKLCLFIFLYSFSTHWLVLHKWPPGCKCVSCQAYAASWRRTAWTQPSLSRHPGGLNTPIKRLKLLHWDAMHRTGTDR